jgi:hypothetical protein
MDGALWLVEGTFTGTDSPDRSGSLHLRFRDHESVSRVLWDSKCRNPSESLHPNGSPLLDICSHGLLVNPRRAETDPTRFPADEK